MPISSSALALEIVRRAKRKKRAAGGRADDDDALLPPPRNPAAPPEGIARAVRDVAGGIGHLIALPRQAMQQGITTEEAVPWASHVAMGMAGTPGAPAGALGSSISRFPSRMATKTVEDFNATSPASKAYFEGAVGNSNLAMDEASRVQRARALGFNVNEPLFHGSGNDFTAFDLRKAGLASGVREQKAAFFSPSPLVASHYADVASVRGARPGETPHGAFEKTYIHKDAPGKPITEFDPYVYDGGQVYPTYVNPGRQKVVDIPYYNTEAVNAAIQQAKRQAYDTVRFKNMSDTGGSGERLDQIAVLNPNNIRSRFATFDPAKKNSSDLLASGAALSPLGAIASASQENNIMPEQRAAGGGVPWYLRNEARSMAHTGPLLSPIGGRTDHIPLNVPGGSYVIPADIVSGVGQGNTLAGTKVLSSMFSSGPYGAPLGKTAAPKPRKKFAAGGAADTVPIAAAGGEYVIDPETVARIGQGDMDQGHAILDAFVLHMRDKHVKELKKLPGPAR